jgi:hypothetical protein
MNGSEKEKALDPAETRQTSPDDFANYDEGA